MPKKRSEIWNHFTPEENRAAKCGYCQKILSLVGGSTGNLMRHLRLKHADLDIQYGQGIIIHEPTHLEGSSLSPKAEISIAMGDEDVVECITSQANDVKSTHSSMVSSIRKRKLVESSPGKESPSMKTSIAYDDLVRFVCCNSKQGTSSDDNFDLVGKNVAMKLRSMEATQKAIAERLIGEILFQGQMEMLEVNTTITTPNTNNITTSTPLRSIVINATSALQTRREVQEQPKTTYIITPHDSTES